MRIYIGPRSVSAEQGPGSDTIVLASALPANQLVEVGSMDGRERYRITVRDLRKLAREHGKIVAVKLATPAA